MALEKDEQASALPYESIDASVFRPRKSAITTIRQFAARQIVPPGMRHPEIRTGVCRQWVI
jgi:hypothetical protein